MVDGLPVCQALLTGSNLGSDRGEQAFERGIQEQMFKHVLRNPESSLKTWEIPLWY